MPRKRTATIESVVASIAAKPDDWDVNVNFTKGVLSGQRGAVVTVTHLPSGRRLKKSRAASTKAKAHQAALSLVSELIDALQQ